MKKVSLIFTMILVMFCTTTYAQDKDMPYDLDDVKIEMHRSICRGSCPSYSLTIWGSGVAYYDGYAFVKMMGHYTANIPENAIIELVNKFYEIDFFSFENLYGIEGIMDIPTTTVSITVNGETKRVRDKMLAPKELKELETMIDRVTDSQKWVYDRQ